MAHVDKGSHVVLAATHTFIYKWNETCLLLLRRHRTSLRIGW